MNKSDSKAAIITGASRGIGAAVAERLARTTSASSSITRAAPHPRRNWLARSKLQAGTHCPFKPM